MITNQDEITRKYHGKQVWCENAEQVRKVVKFGSNATAWSNILKLQSGSFTLTDFSKSGVSHTSRCRGNSYNQVLVDYPNLLRYSDIIEDFEESINDFDIEETEREYKILKWMNTMEIKLSEILAHFKAGVERWKADDQGKGSIEEIYGLTTSECMELFKNPLVKGRKVTKIKEQQTA